MPIVTVLQGPRNTEQKRQLVAEITDAFDKAYGLPADAVQVWIQEFPPESWGADGKLKSDS